MGLEPLYKTVPIAARRDPRLYEILALLDALRDGRARERRLAEEHLVSLLHRQVHARPYAIQFLSGEKLIHVAGRPPK